MFALIRNIIFLSVFTVFILVASHIFKINGRTVSDQIKSTMSGIQQTKDKIQKTDQEELKKLLKDLSP